MASFNVSNETMTQLLMLQTQQMAIIQSILTGISVSAPPAGASGAGSKKSGKAKRTGSMPKGVMPPHLEKWNAYVDSVEVQLKAMNIDDVWAEWVATDPKDKEGNSKATEDKRSKFKVIRQIAMAIAKARKEAGSMPAEFEHKPMTTEEKGAAKTARATNATAPVATEEKPKKVRKAKVKAPEPVPVPVPVTNFAVESPNVDADEDDGVDLVDFKFKGKTYLRAPGGECWARNADGTRGKWAGKYDEVKDKIDPNATEPEVDEE